MLPLNTITLNDAFAHFFVIQGKKPLCPTFSHFCHYMLTEAKVKAKKGLNSRKMFRKLNNLQTTSKTEKALKIYR